MRNFIGFLAALFLAIAIGASLYVYRKSTTARAEIAAAQAQVAQTASQLDAEKSQRQSIEKERDQLIKIADETGSQLRKVSSNAPAPSEPEASKPGLGKLMAQMMADPETRKFVREQQRVAMEQLYTPLIKKLGLTPQESTEFQKLLLDRTIANSEKAMTLVGAPEGEERAKALQTLAEEQKSFEEDVRSFLGESRYAEYKTYQDTVGERTQLNMFRQNDVAGRTLTDEQTDQLLSAMAQEKKTLQESGAFFPGSNQDPAAMQSMLQEEQAAKVLDAQELLNQRVYQRAAGMLSDDQLQSFARFQTNQLQMMRVGLKMARQMLGQ